MASSAAKRSYRLRPYPGRLSVLRGLHVMGPGEGSVGRWSEFAMGGCDFYEINASHDDFFKEPGIFEVAEAITTAIEKTLSEEKRSEV